MEHLKNVNIWLDLAMSQYFTNLVTYSHLAFRILEKLFWGQNGHTKDGPQVPGGPSTTLSDTLAVPPFQYPVQLHAHRLLSS